MGNHEELLKQEITLSDENWDGLNSTEINIGSANSGQLCGASDYPCLSEDDEDYPKVKDDLSFFGRLVCQSIEMYKAMQEFCDRVDRGEVKSVKTYAKFKEILSKINNP